MHEGLIILTLAFYRTVDKYSSKKNIRQMKNYNTTIEEVMNSYESSLQVNTHYTSRIATLKIVKHS